jgi:hypothetical protein
VDKWDYFQNGSQDFFFLFFSFNFHLFFFKYETIVRSSAWSFGHSDPDPDPSSVLWRKHLNLDLQTETPRHFLGLWLNDGTKKWMPELLKRNAFMIEFSAPSDDGGLLCFG